MHELNEDDFDYRLKFCEEYLLAIEPDPPECIVWTDKAQFKLNSTVN